MYDLLIIGGGPAGTAAGVYASRKQLKTLFITKEWGGQSIVSPDIQNWIGTASLSGAQLAKDLENHLRAYAEDFVTIEEKEVSSIVKTDEGFTTSFKDGGEVQSKTILITTGSKRRQLGVEGADTFEHKGLTYCATCDGPLFAGQDVAVIGGGNAGFETAAQLLAYAKSVTLIHRNDQYRADPVTVEKVLSHENMTGILNVQLKSVEGDQFLSGVTYTDAEGTDHNVPVTGVFVEIGMVPATDFVADVVERDDYNRITIDPWTKQTSTPGIWAAGDCTNIKYHQNNISAGDAVTALEDIYVHLKTK
jgi:alkyl hydroperoxide reductase subunit F